MEKRQQPLFLELRPLEWEPWEEEEAGTVAKGEARVKGRAEGQGSEGPWGGDTLLSGGPGLLWLRVCGGPGRGRLCSGSQDDASRGLLLGG